MFLQKRESAIHFFVHPTYNVYGKVLMDDTDDMDDICVSRPYIPLPGTVVVPLRDIKSLDCVANKIEHGMSVFVSVPYPTTAEVTADKTGACDVSTNPSAGIAKADAGIAEAEADADSDSDTVAATVAAVATDLGKVEIKGGKPPRSLSHDVESRNLFTSQSQSSHLLSGVHLLHSKVSLSYESQTSHGESLSQC